MLEWHPILSITYSCQSTDSFQLTRTEIVVKNNLDFPLISWTRFNESRKLIEIELIASDKCHLLSVGSAILIRM